MSVSPNGRRECSVCVDEKITYQCKGCLRDFCYKHLSEHRQIFIEELCVVESDRDEFRNILTQQKENLPHHPTMQKIHKWESDAIKKIKQTAEECRETFMEQALLCYNEIEVRLNRLHNDILVTREENEFNEIILEQLRLKLTKLIEELALAPNVAVQQDSSTYINKIFIISSSTGQEIIRNAQPRTSTSGKSSAKYAQNGITIAGGNGEGQRSNQLVHPEGFFLDDDLNLYIADTGNHRALKWKYGEKNGEVVAGGHGKGDRSDQLDGPTSVVVDKRSNSLIISDWGNKRVVKWSQLTNSLEQILIADIKCGGLTMDSQGYLYVTDWKRNEVKKWRVGDKDGVVVAGGNGSGNNLNQLNRPTFVFVNNTDHSVYISDQSNHRVVKWAKNSKEGVVVAGHKGQGNQLAQLSRPQGICLDQSGQLFIADCDNHRIVRFNADDAQFSVVVGGKGQGDQSSQLNAPFGLVLDKEGHLYVVDSENHRIQKYQLVHP